MAGNIDSKTVPISSIKDKDLVIDSRTQFDRGKTDNDTPPGRGGTFNGHTVTPVFPDGHHIDDFTPDLNVPDNQPGSDTDSRKEEYPSSDRDHTVKPLDGSGVPNSISPFIPDPNLSTEENLANLTAWIDSLFSTSYLNGDLYSGGLYANILSSVWNAVYRIGTFASLDSEARFALTEKVADVSWSIISQQFSQALSYQTWYLQQEYNSPLQQVNRLAAAGLSTSFALGSLNSGNASSPASVIEPQQIQSSGAADIQRQGQANDLQFIGSLVSAASSFLPGAAGAVGTLVSSFATKKLSAKQCQLANQEIINSAAVYEKIKAETNQISSSPGLQLFDYALKQSNQVVQQKGQEVSLAQNRYDSSLSLGTRNVKVSGYRVKVVDKQGHQRDYDLTVDGVKDLINNHGVTKEGYKAVGADTWNVGGNLKVSGQGFWGIPGIGGGKLSGSVGVHGGYQSTSSKENNSESEQGFSRGSESNKSKSGYSEHGTSFSIGDTKFDSIEIEQRMTLPEHKDYIERCRKELDKALMEYNTLTTGERARMLDLLNHTTESLSDFQAKFIHSLFMNQINSIFEPKTLVGD